MEIVRRLREEKEITFIGEEQQGQTMGMHSSMRAKKASHQKRPNYGSFAVVLVKKLLPNRVFP